MSKEKSKGKLENAVKAVQRQRFIAVNTDIKKEERSQINNPILQLKKLEKEEETKSKGHRRKAVIKIGVQKNKIENIKTIQKSIKSNFFSD